VTGTTVWATKEPGEPNHAGFAGGHSIWCQYTAAGSGTATIDTFGSNFDTLLAVYTGNAVNALTAIASNDDTSPGTQSRVQFSAVAAPPSRCTLDGWPAASGSAM